MSEPQEPQEVFIKGLRRQRWREPSAIPASTAMGQALRAKREQREQQQQQQVQHALASPYYWWWLFLRESQEFAQARAARPGSTIDQRLRQLARDFGDLQRGDFAQWWLSRGVDLFKQTQPRARVREMMATETVPVARTNARRLYLEVPLTVRRSTVLRQINQLLDPHYRDQPQGRLNVFAHSTARYEINRSSKLRQRTIEQIYRVWIERQANPEETWWQLGTRLKISPAFINHAHTPKAVTVNNNRLMTLTVQRLYRKAVNMIYWAARGEFPCVKTPPRDPINTASGQTRKAQRPVAGR
jgi:hypothetical protein